MPGNFNPNRPAKGFRHALGDFFNVLRGGLLQDFARVNSGASPVLARPTVYETKVRTSGAATQQVVQLPPAPAGSRPGARHLISIELEGVGGDSIRINAGASARLIQEAFQIAGVTGYTNPTVVTNVDLAAAGDFALFEWLGGANGDWNLVYAQGATLS